MKNAESRTQWRMANEPSMPMIDRETIVSALRSDSFDAADRAYLAYHAERLAETVNLLSDAVVRAFRPAGHAPLPSHKARVLDVGPHLLTAAIHRFLGDRVSVSTIGWMNRRLVPEEAVDEHVEWDLNVELPANPFASGPFDIVMMGETIEHLHTAPTIVLRGLKRCLRADGGLLVVQTPNAVSLSRRLAMLAGRNPFEMIRENTRDPGHFREYTAAELVAIGASVGLSAQSVRFTTYYKSARPKRLVEFVFPSLRNGLVVVFRSRSL